MKLEIGKPADDDEGPPLHLWLYRSPAGDVFLKAKRVGQDSEFNLLMVTTDGRVIRCRGVDGALGLRTNHNGSVEVEEN